MQYEIGKGIGKGIGLVLGRIHVIECKTISHDGISIHMLEAMQRRANENYPYKVKLMYDKDASQKAEKVVGMECVVLVCELVIDDPPQNVRLREVE